MFDIRTALLAVAVGLGVGAVGSWYLTAKYQDALWTASIEKQKVDAAKELQAATDRAILAERRQNELATQLEMKHVESEKELDKALSNNRRLARELGGLRDPGRRPSCSAAAPTDSTTTAQLETSPAGTELSTEASEFLLEFARDADRAAQYAKTCYDWSQQLNRE